MVRQSVPAAGERQVSVGTELGWVVAKLDGDRVVEVTIVPEPPAGAPARDPLARRVSRALAAYFRDGRWPTDLPIAPGGTPFQRRVWGCLRRIPPGATRSYGDIARELGSGARAVGNACRANPLLLLIPCHRCVAAHGRGGFHGQLQGRWPAIKDWLLDHEQGRV